MILNRSSSEAAALCALLSIWICVIITCVSKEHADIIASAEGDPGPVMIIDPGHGGMDGGAVSAAGKKESDINWQISERLRDLAGFLGISAVMTRNSCEIEYPPELTSVAACKKWDTRKRTALINSVVGGVLISIHQNYYPSSGPSGPQVLYNVVDGGRSLAEMIRDRFFLIADNEVRNVSAADRSIYILSHAVCPGVIVECGFLSNSREAMLLESEGHQLRLTVCIAAAFLDYTGDEVA